MTFYRQMLHIAFYAEVFDKPIGIEFHMLEIKGIDLHLFPEERKKLNVDDQLSHIGNGVA